MTSAVRINERQEWTRRWDGDWKGMASPVLQARRQAEVLRAVLQAHKGELRGKVLLGLRQGGFARFMIDVVVAISDGGVIESQGTLPEVRKADQVPERVKELIADHVQLTRVFSRDKRANEWGFCLPAEDFARTSAFLKARHQEKPRPLPATSHCRSTLPTAFVCRHCQRETLEVAFGRSYYFKCTDCQGNTPIHLTCPACKGLQRTRKRGQHYFAECAPCGTSTLYFTNG